MAKKPQTTDAGVKTRVTMLKEVRLDEFSLILRPGDNVKLSAAILSDPRMTDNFKAKD